MPAASDRSSTHELPTQAGATNKTRVLLVTNSVAVGGMEEHVKLIARHLDRTQFEVFGISPDWPDTAVFQEALTRVVDHSAVVTPDRRHGLVSQATEMVKLYRRLRTWQIDVMHMHSTTFRGQVGLLAVARLAGVKRIFMTEHLAPDGQLPLVPRVIRNLYSRAVDGIVCVSQKNYAARRTYIFTPPDRSHVVNNGVDIDDFVPISEAKLAELRRQHNIPTHAAVVGTAVRFEPEKGLEYLLDAMPLIKAACPEAVLLMVGDGSLRADLEAHVRRLGLSESVRFVGFQRDPRPYLALMDAFVLPVPVGSMSIGLLEAMAMRRAAVITFGGDGEAVVHNESGFCAAPRHPESIAHYVVRILRDPELKHALGSAARDRVQAEFSAQHVARVLGVLYRG